MARPKKKPDDKRTARLPALRMTPQELELTKQAAANLGLPVTTFARDMILNGQVITGEGEGVIDPTVILELQRIGNNLNQAVKKFHQTGKPPAQLEAVALRVNRFLDLIIDEIV